VCLPGRDQDPEAVNSQNDAGYTALHHAAKHGSKELIDILVKAGADQMIENNAGETPYMVAHKYQQWDAERLLLNAEQQHGTFELASSLGLSCTGVLNWTKAKSDTSPLMYLACM
jgi:ankyrin repeat protein